jgi:hypothetical protein
MVSPTTGEIRCCGLGVVLRGIDAERRNASRRGNIHLTAWKIFALFAQGFYFFGGRDARRI